MKNLRSRLTLLFIIFIDGIGISIVYPIFAYYFLQDYSTLFTLETSYEARLFYLGLAFAIYPFCMAIGSLLIGKTSDRFGRKKSLVVCLSGFSSGFFITALGIFLNLYWLLILGRAISGLTAGAHVIAQASMADLSKGAEKTKNMGAIIMASTLGFVIGPGLGGILSSPEIVPFFSTRTPFSVVAVMGLIGLGLTLVFFQETYSKKNPQEAAEAVSMRDLHLFKNPFLRQLAIIYFSFTLGWNFFFQFTPIYLEEFFLVSATMTGGFMSFIALIFMGAIALIVRPALAHLSLINGLCLGLLLLLLSIAFMLHITTFNWLWLITIPFCIGGGFAYTTSLSLFSDAASDVQQGHMMGIASMVKSAAWTLAPIISGVIAYFDLHWPMIVASFCFAVALVLCGRLKT